MDIACIIVTYNRKNLLLNCLDAINSQTIKPRKIFVIDNASSDGTDECIHKYESGIALDYIRLDKNIGGAGGFYTGIKTAFEESRYNYYWVMDDDGQPDAKCLENLLKHSEYDFIAPLVLDIENRDNVAFPYLKEKTLSEIQNQYGKDGLIHNYANPFNGVLFSHRLVAKIGYPKKEMFIWGDEAEYQCRATVNGFSPVTVIDAIHYHPLDRIKFEYDIFGRKTIIYVESKLRRYCKYRNSSFIASKYGGTLSKISFYMSYITFFLFSRKADISGLKFFLNAARDGRKGIFKNHNKYMN